MPVEKLIEAILDPSVRPVAIGTAALGAVTGFLGTFAVVRRQSLQGDAISHAALPGVALIYMLGGRSEILLVIGAGLTGWLAMVVVSGIVRRSRIPFDAALGGTLSVFFGLGLALLVYIQRNTPGAATFRPQQFLFGQDAALMRSSDLWPVLILGGLAVTVAALCWKEFKILSFDADFTASLGYPTRVFELLLSALIVIAVILGLQTVGVVLMSALIVAPATAGRQWSDRLGWVAIISSVCGATAGFTGTILSHLLSTTRSTVPTGPTIVLVATFFTLISLIIAPRGGLIRFIGRNRKRVPPSVSQAA